MNNCKKDIVKPLASSPWEPGAEPTKVYILRNIYPSSTKYHRRMGALRILVLNNIYYYA